MVTTESSAKYKMVSCCHI